MTVSVLIFYTRRPEVTPEYFQTYMEENHVPLIKEVFTDQSPLTYTLRYPTRVSTGMGDRLGAVTSSTSKADPTSPVVLVGEPNDVKWDALGEMKFRDELHIQQCLAVMNEPAGQRIKEDEETFALTEKTTVIIMGENSVFI